MRHKWQETATGFKCAHCGMKSTMKNVKSTHYSVARAGGGSGKVLKAFFQPKGGEWAVYDKTTPPCLTDSQKRVAAIVLPSGAALPKRKGPKRKAKK